MESESRFVPEEQLTKALFTSVRRGYKSTYRKEIKYTKHRVRHSSCVVLILFDNVVFFANASSTLHLTDC